jgi:hypothetical protein
MVDFVWCLEVEDLPGSGVEPIGDVVEVVLREAGQVGSLGQILRITVTVYLIDANESILGTYFGDTPLY